MCVILIIQTICSKVQLLETSLGGKIRLPYMITVHTEARNEKTLLGATPARE